MQEEVYAKEVLEFVVTANDYVLFLEEQDNYSLKEFVDKAHQILPELYFRLTKLPKVNSEFEDLNQKFVTEEDYEFLRQKLLKKFGEYDSFEEVFDNNRIEVEDHIGESISEYLTDIYQDIKDFVLLYQIGTNEVMYEAVWELRQSFEEYWGQKLANTLRAIHNLRYGPEELEENEESEPGQADKQISENRNASDWFISRRQEDLRDEE